MTRLLSGIVLIALVLAAVWLAPPFVFLLVVELALVGAVLEYQGLAAQTGLSTPRAAGVVAAGITAAAVGWPGIPLVHILATVLIALCLVTLATNLPARHVPASAAAGLFPVLYVGLPMGLVAATRTQFGRGALLFVILLVVVSDTAQFYVGSAIGRHRLAPAISPKKSVEGAIAGLAGGAVVAAAAGDVAWPSLSPVWRAALGVILAAIGISGDLFESLLKRSAEVKDSSGLIPGHGGVLDRIDALLLVVPAYYIFLVWLK